MGFLFDSKFLFIIDRFKVQLINDIIVQKVQIFNSQGLIHMLLHNTPYREEFIEAVFESAHYCLVIVDDQGHVIYLNQSYCDFLGVRLEDAVGKHVTDVIENTRMHIVVETGTAEIADLQYIRGNYMIANRVPVWSDGKVIGAIGVVLYRDTKEWMKMNSHIKALLLEVEQYRNQLKKNQGAVYSLHDIVAISAKMIDLKNKVKRVATGEASVLITGESGTGKELIAHSIHQLSERSGRPFVTVNCAAIPEHLIESELFGYQDGAFTGAKKGGKEGKFQVANGGTIFLDEIGDMPLSAQVKILRVLQDGEVHPVGGVKPEKVDVRVIAATNQDLEKLVQEKAFREDLFYRINVLRLHIPPLRERQEDIRVLAKYFLHKSSDRSGKRVLDFDQQVLERFMQYDWPGNVRELENVVEASVHLTNQEMISIDDLPEHFQKQSVYLDKNSSLKEILERTEKQAIEQAILQCDGDKIRAAKRLGIGKSSLYDKLKKYGL